MTTSGSKPGEGFARRSSWLGDWLEAWNSFWFTPADPLPLALVRICAGALLAWASCVWLLDAEAFFGNDGW